MEPIRELGKWLILSGAFVAIVGAFLYFAGKFAGLGKMPGDILVKKDHWTFYFPITTCLLLSLLLTALLQLLPRR